MTTHNVKKRREAINERERQQRRVERDRVETECKKYEQQRIKSLTTYDPNRLQSIVPKVLDKEKNDSDFIRLTGGGGTAETLDHSEDDKSVSSYYDADGESRRKQAPDMRPDLSTRKDPTNGKQKPRSDAMGSGTESDASILSI